MGNLYVSLYESVLYLCRAWRALLCAGQGGADGANAGGHARGQQQLLQEGQVQARPLPGQLYFFWGGSGGAMIGLHYNIFLRAQADLKIDLG